MDVLNDYAENAQIQVDLRKPFDSRLLSKVNKGFGAIDTINHAVVTDRLNKVCPGWTMGEPQFITVDGADGMKHCLAVVNWMQIGTVRRYEIGESERPSTFGDEAKKAMSDWIKRAAMRFGVAIDLWAKEDLNVTSGGESTSQSNTGQGSVTSPRDASGAQASADGMSAEDASPSLSVLPGGGTDEAAPGDQGTVALGEGAPTPGETPGAATYLTKAEQTALIKRYGSNKAVVEKYRERYGDRIQRIGDITHQMVGEW